MPGMLGHCTYGFDHFGSHGPAMSPQTIARPSAASLFLEMRQAGKKIGTATGFIVERGGKRYLVTNRHVVRGLQPDGTAIPPDRLVIYQNVADNLGKWEPKEERLHTPKGSPRWFEHPTRSAEIDVAALVLENDAGIGVYPYDPWAPTSIFLAAVGEPLNIIGFPFGITGGGALGVWVRGFTATEPSLDWNGLPCFLIDSRTRQGQSGSPVIGYTSGGAVPTSGGVSFFSGPVEEFVGVYSGRINRESDLGFVWKASVVREIIEAKKTAV